MTQTLAMYFSLYVQNPKQVEGSLVTPVLLYELPGDVKEEETDTDNRYRYKTVSGVAVVAEPGEPNVFLLSKTKDNAFQRGVTVGRTANNDLVLDDASVSRFHAWFQRAEEGSGWWVVDAGSKNGTLLDGQRLPAKRPTALPEDTTLKFGQVEVRFLLPEPFIQLLKTRSAS
jgi:hypothetical protein